MSLLSRGASFEGVWFEGRLSVLQFDDAITLSPVWTAVRGRSRESPGGLTENVGTTGAQVGPIGVVFAD
jgi:hypothetical protein